MSGVHDVFLRDECAAHAALLVPRGCLAGSQVALKATRHRRRLMCWYPLSANDSSLQEALGAQRQR
jgi:hypothetical protein